MGVVPGPLAVVGEHLVGVEDLLEAGGGGLRGDARGRGFVRVVLQGKALVGGADIVGGGVAVHAQHLVEAPLLSAAAAGHRCGPGLLYGLGFGCVEWLP